MFNDKIDGILDSICEKMPNGNIGAAVVALNTLFYGAYCFWPSYAMHSYLNNFTFSMYGLNNGYFHNLITCHFAHQSILAVVLDSVIIFLLSTSLM